MNNSILMLRLIFMCRPRSPIGPADVEILSLYSYMRIMYDKKRGKLGI